jgi:hypothetical protein
MPENNPLAAALEARAKATPGPWYEQNSSSCLPGIRAKRGFLFFTPAVFHYSGQDERYEQELAERDVNVKAAIAAPDALDWIADVMAGMEEERDYLQFMKKGLSEAEWQETYPVGTEQLARLESLLARVKNSIKIEEVES